MNHQLLTTVPAEFLAPCVKELDGIDWHHLPYPDDRRRLLIFQTSYAVHLRVLAEGSVTSCENSPIFQRFPSHVKLLAWVEAYLETSELGRAMIVNLISGGSVANHVDDTSQTFPQAGVYFKKFKRFFVPLVTHESALVTGDVSSHVPAGTLTQLDNSRLHGAINPSTIDRVHLILDAVSDLQVS